MDDGLRFEMAHIFSQETQIGLRNLGQTESETDQWSWLEYTEQWLTELAECSDHRAEPLCHSPSYDRRPLAHHGATREPPNHPVISRRRAHARGGSAHVSGWQALGWYSPALIIQCLCFARALADQEQGSGTQARDARFGAATSRCLPTDHARR